MANHRKGQTGTRRRRRAEKRALDFVDGRRIGYRCHECGVSKPHRGAYKRHMLACAGAGAVHATSGLVV